MYAPDVTAQYADVGYWKERAAIAEQELQRQKIQLRDAFAKAALTGVIAPTQGTWNANRAAQSCYQIADAMLKAREEKV